MSGGAASRLRIKERGVIKMRHGNNMDEWREVLMDISEVARISLKNLVAQNCPPLPSCYEREFVSVAAMLDKQAILKAARKDQNLLANRLQEVISLTRNSVKDAREILCGFEKGARRYLVDIDKKMEDIRLTAGDRNKEHVEALNESIDSIKSANQDLLSRLVNALAGMEKQEKTLKRLKKQVNEDPLTTVLNRRSWDRDLEEMVRRSLSQGEEGRTFSIALADLDYFKKVNDTYGHPVGDAVLKQFSSLLKDHFLSSGTVYRYGGEEFSVLLPGFDRKDAYDSLEIFRQRLTRTCFTADNGRMKLKITASFGVCEWKKDLTAVDMVHRVDKALYAAKQSGRNCVKIIE